MKVCSVNREQGLQMIRFRQLSNESSEEISGEYLQYSLAFRKSSPRCLQPNYSLIEQGIHFTFSQLVQQIPLAQRTARQICGNVCWLQRSLPQDTAMPRNIPLSRHLITIANQKASNSREKDQIEYYKYFFLRMEAFKSGKTSEFNLSSEMLNRLAEQRQHPQSCYLAGKQIFNLSQSTKNVENQKKMIKLAAHYFELSLNDNQYGGLYYLGEILRNGEFTQITEEEVREFFILGAAMGDPMSYFRMALIYLEESKSDLYLKYLKMAAESGVMQAQHNLGCEYLEGGKVKKDEVKALAWFMHAGANGFIESKYNLVFMFLKGSSCYRIKVNKKVALLYLQQLLKLGEPVEDKIKQLVKSQELQGQQQQIEQAH